MRHYEPDSTEYEQRTGHAGNQPGVLFQRTKTFRCGEQLEAEIFPVLEWERGQRAERKKRTPEQMARVNRRNREKHLTRLMNLNFGPGDLLLNALTTDKPCSWQEFNRRVDALLRWLRRQAKKAGQALKYILHLERTGDGAETRYHVHGIINGGIVSRDEIEDWWRWGTANVDRAKAREKGLAGYAKYMLQKKDGQETAGKRAFRCSRNLKRPDRRPALTISDHKFSRAQAGKLARGCQEDARALFERKYPGYRLIEYSVHYSDFLPGVYIYAWLEKINSAPERSARG